MEIREGNAPYDLIDNKIVIALKQAGHKKRYVTYSAYETDEHDQPIDNLDQIAVSGAVVLIAERSDDWGGPRSRDYRAPVLKDPTW
jgi:hypothetical protein